MNPFQFAEHPIQIPAGRDYEITLRPTTTQIIYKPISAIPAAAPARLTVTAHGVPNGWPVQAKGKREASPLIDLGAQYATVIDANTIELNALESLDWPAYTSGDAVLAYNEPMSLTGFTFALSVRELATDATAIFTISSAGGQITVVNSVLLMMVPNAMSALLTDKRYTYTLEATETATSKKFLVLYGPITVVR